MERCKVYRKSERFLNFQVVNMNDDWKLLNIFIGGNDMCGYCGNKNLAPAVCVSHIQEAVRIIYDNVPRVLVSLTGMLQLQILRYC